MITFGREVNLFWTHKYTGASVLFFANRYVTLAWNLMGLAQFGHISEQVSTSYSTLPPLYVDFVQRYLFFP